MIRNLDVLKEDAKEIGGTMSVVDRNAANLRDTVFSEFITNRISIFLNNVFLDIIMRREMLLMKLEML